MTARIARQIVLARRPAGQPVLQDFAIRSATLPALKQGQVVVQNQWMSVDPYMRLYLSDQAGLHGSLPLGTVLSGSAVGEVIESASPSHPVGSFVVSQSKGWQDRYIDDAKALQSIDPAHGPIQHYLGLFGLTGITAYAGVMVELLPQADETLFVSGGAGAVGSIAVQLGKLAGARVIASAGSSEKCHYLTDVIGADAAINYKTDDVVRALREFAPDGLDMYFDNVGGPQLEAAIDAMAVRGRIALCGAIAMYDTENYRAGPSNMFAVIEKGITLQGFNAGLYPAKAQEFIGALGALLAASKIKWHETVVEGFDNAPGAFIDMLKGANTGKMLVKVD